MTEPKACSALVPNAAGGHNCKHGHAYTQHCAGIAYPDGLLLPMCVREDRVFDEKHGVVTIRPWKGE